VGAFLHAFLRAFLRVGKHSHTDMRAHLAALLLLLKIWRKGSGGGGWGVVG
jgi:hypothetical protein